MLTRDQILEKDDFEYTTVPVKEWGGDVRIRGLTARERDEFEIKVGIKEDLDNMRAGLVVMCVVDDDGKRLFDKKDAAIIGQKNAIVVDKIFDAIRSLSGMTVEDVVELEKN